MSPSDQVYQPAAAPRVGGIPTSGTSVRPPVSASAVPQKATAATVAPPRPDTVSTPAAPRPSAPQAAPAQVTGPRTVRLTLARVDPWSVLKLSFLLSVALGIGLVTGTVVLWSVIDQMGVLNELNKVLRDIGGSNSTFSIYDYVGLGRVVSLSTFIGVINVVIIMALSTLGAFLYNIASSLVGGLHVTLSDD